MDVIEAIHTRRSIRSYLHQPVGRELIEQMIWDAAQAPPPFSGQATLGLSMLFFRAVERISAYGDEALHDARDNHPDEPGWEWTDRPEFEVFWCASALIIISGRVEDCCRAGQNLMLSAHAKRSRHLLGGFANVVAENRTRQGKTKDFARVGARLGTVSRLSGSDFRGPATQAAPDHLARMSTAMAIGLVSRDRRSAMGAPVAGPSWDNAPPDRCCRKPSAENHHLFAPAAVNHCQGALRHRTCRWSAYDLRGAVGRVQVAGGHGAAAMFTIVTTNANLIMAELHDRMSAILEPQDLPTWLGEVGRPSVRKVWPAANS